MVGPDKASDDGARTVTLPYAHLRDLQEREHQLAVTQRLVHVGGWALDLSANTLDWSDELFRIFGLDPNASVPTTAAYFAAIDASHRHRCRTLVEDLLSTGLALSYDCPIHRPDGEVRWIRAECRLERDQAGKPIRAYGTAQDITDFFGTDHVAQEGAGAGRTSTGPGQWFGQALTTDAVTFDARAVTALSRASRYGWSTALLFVEAIGLAQPFSGPGWASASAVGEDMTRRILSALRPYDAVVPSFPPVEPGAVRAWTFTILCENVSNDVAAVVAGRIAELFDGGLTIDELQAPLSVEVGYAVAEPGDTDLEALRARACASSTDTAAPLPSDTEPFVNAAGLELQRAFDAGQLSLYYQPKVALDRDRVVGVEALLRWEHPERGMVLPLSFIPLAEQTGLIIPIGDWILDEACAQASRWHRRYPQRTNLAVSVNLSVRQFGPDLVGVVHRALVRNDTLPSWLCLEITESLLMDNLDEAMDVLVGLSELGVLLSIDDFGTGFSSLARLKQFPVNEIKIDKAFIDGLGVEANDTAIVAAIVSMAHAMRLSVVAEGVETSEQLERLRTLGCDEVQGFLLGRPGPAASLDLLLADERRLGWRSHPGEPLPASGAEPDGYRPERVLVVDDTADVRELAVISLTAAGFDVHSACDGSSALAEAGRLRPDCVVLDVLLPDINGLEICQALRTNPVTAQCTIVMLSSVADSNGKAAAFSAGADDYIVKPFSPRDLTSRVRAAMRRRRADADAGLVGAALAGAGQVPLGDEEQATAVGSATAPDPLR